MKKTLTLILALVFLQSIFAQSETFKISLDGEWQIAEGSLDAIPESFPSTIQVPGFVDTATPSFGELGCVVTNNWDYDGIAKTGSPRPADPNREAFWYKRTFDINQIPAFAELKINKACYTVQVFINGKKAGTRYTSYTPNYFDITPLLKEGENTIVVRIGAGLSAVPQQYTDGFDFERKKYIPGIYDSVSISYSEEKFIKDVQIAPNLKNSGIRVVGSVWNFGKEISSAPLKFTVLERKSKKIVTTYKAETAEIMPTQDTNFDVFIKIPNAQLWSPESPFLYELEISTTGYETTHRFGMRTFKGDEEQGVFILNDKPYYMRGTNITFFRFVEDENRKDLPFKEEWVRKLFAQFKSMNWNSMRFCIGFPPEKWYEYADEMGFLIQDEFPVWYENFSDTRDLDSNTLAGEYSDWMREHWNYPSVVIWDPVNESIPTHEMEIAKRKVRGLDLSDRPWDNAWGWRARFGDVNEAHPYKLINYARQKLPFPQYLAIDSIAVPVHDGKNYITTSVPKLINEYGFLWLRRDGSPCLITKSHKLYEHILNKEDFTIEEARIANAHSFALLTEHWRHKGRNAAVFHFVSLDFDSDYATTCDNFTDIVNLTMEPTFEKYVRDSFSPIGVGLHYYETDISPNSENEFEIFLVNDTYQNWSGKLTLRIKSLDNTKVIAEKSMNATCPEIGKESFKMKIQTPNEGKYILEAEISPVDSKSIKSIRYLYIK